MRAAELPHHPGPGACSAPTRPWPAAILLLGLFLAATGGSLVQRWRSSPGRQQSLGFEDQLGVAANTAGLIVIVWWAMSFAIAVAAALLDRCGKARAASAAGKFTPAFMRRLALAAVGLQLVTAPLATASPLPARSRIPRGRAGNIRSVDAGGGAGHTRNSAARRRCHPPGRRSPALRPWPIHNGGRSARSSTPAPWRGARCGSSSRGAPFTEVTVRPGDSLWSLSSARLGPFASDVDIALDWPRIYQANREIIGGNPNLLQAGPGAPASARALNPQTPRHGINGSAAPAPPATSNDRIAVLDRQPTAKEALMSALPSPRAAAEARAATATPLRLVPGGAAPAAAPASGPCIPATPLHVSR